MVDILLVEGHPFIQKMLRSQIEAESDLRVICEAIDGPSAIDQARRARPDTIIIDIDTPGVQGMDVVRVIHQHLPEIPIILLSLSDDDALRSTAFEAGAVEFIAKEANTAMFLAAIRRSIHRPPGTG